MVTLSISPIKHQARIYHQTSSSYMYLFMFLCCQLFKQCKLIIVQNSSETALLDNSFFFTFHSKKSYLIRFLRKKRNKIMHGAQMPQQWVNRKLTCIIHECRDTIKTQLLMLKLHTINFKSFKPLVVSEIWLTGKLDVWKNREW